MSRKSGDSPWNLHGQKGTNHIELSEVDPTSSSVVGAARPQSAALSEVGSAAASEHQPRIGGRKPYGLATFSLVVAIVFLAIGVVIGVTIGGSGGGSLGGASSGKNARMRAGRTRDLSRIDAVVSDAPWKDRKPHRWCLQSWEGGQRTGGESRRREFD